MNSFRLGHIIPSDAASLGVHRSLWAKMMSICKNIASRRPLARLLSTFLCSLVILIRPFSHLGGPNAFLALSLKELVFPVQANLAQQLELTLLNIMGAFFGISVSTLAKYIASLCPLDSNSGRSTCAVFLIVICFFAGLVKSRLPRLQLSTRISCFVSIWLLTNNIGVPSKVLQDSGYFLWITLTPATISLLSLVVVMIFVRWSSTSFEREIAATFSLLHECLSTGLIVMFPNNHQSAANEDQYRSLHTNLLKRSIMLNETYSQAAFELRVGRLSLKSIKPLIGIVEHLRRELAWGFSLSHPPLPAQRPRLHRRGSSRPLSPASSRPLSPASSQSHFSFAIEDPALSLGHAILSAMKCVESTVLLAFYGHGSSASPSLFTPLFSRGPEVQPWTRAQLKEIRRAEDNLLSARDRARQQLEKFFDAIDMAQRADTSEGDLSQEMFKRSLSMIALLQMSHESRLALQISRNLAHLYDESRTRFWYPRISLAWLGVSPGPFISDDPDAQLSTLSSASEKTTAEVEADLSDAERLQGFAERTCSLDPQFPVKWPWTLVSPPLKTQAVARHTWLWHTLVAAVSWLFSNTRALRVRMTVWKFKRSILHSSHLRHALKNAIGVAILTIPAFMPASSDARRWYTSVHGQWMTISYVWVLETNTGATWRTGYLRIFGTILGAIYAYITWLICKTNPYGIQAMVTVADIPITWLVIKANLTPLATPAWVTLPPIVYTQYISPNPSVHIAKLALLRALMIGAGMIAALLMNSLVFPRHCRALFLSDTSRTLGLLTELYLTLSHNMFLEKHALARDGKQRHLKLELQIRNALHRLLALLTTMHDELSLLPKPLRHYQRVIIVLQKALDLMTGLRKIRENIPRKETVSEVFKERRDFMSCVSVTLFACQHAFRARGPLPQFLPSVRHAFINLESHVQECMRQAREADSHAMGLSLVYAYAEQEALRNLVDTLEELLELCGKLFGTSAWLTQEPVWSRSSTLHEGDHGWYSTFKWEEA